MGPSCCPPTSVASLASRWSHLLHHWPLTSWAHHSLQTPGPRACPPGCPDCPGRPFTSSLLCSLFTWRVSNSRPLFPSPALSPAPGSPLGLGQSGSRATSHQESLEIAVSRLYPGSDLEISYSGPRSYWCAGKLARREQARKF